MGNYNLPVNIDTTYADSATDPSVKIHQQHHDTFDGFINKFDTAYVPTAVAGDHIMFVSKAGSDANSGFSWGLAKLTINAAITAMSSNQGKIFVGGGTWDEIITGSPDFTLIGMGPYDTFLRLTSNGDLLSAVNESDIILRDLCLEFASASVTGRLAYISNGFRHRYDNVRFLGQDVAGQIGLDLDANSGDCHFINCKFENLGIGHRSITSMSYIDHAHFTSNLTACLIGDPTNVDDRGGLNVSNTAFIGSGDYYVDVDGSALAVVIDKCWFDGDATTAVKVGKSDGVYGPRMFAMTNITALFGLVTSLLLYKATRIYLDNVKFHHGGGTPPTEISIPTPANVPQGHVNGVRSNQGLLIESLVPPGWDGYKGYFVEAGGVSGVETTTRMDAGSTRVHKRVVVRVTGRLSGDGATVITYPAAFETGDNFLVVNANAWAGTSKTQTTFTIPTGLSGSNIFVIEGW